MTKEEIEARALERIKADPAFMALIKDRIKNDPAYREQMIRALVEDMADEVWDNLKASGNYVEKVDPETGEPVCVRVKST